MRRRAVLSGRAAAGLVLAIGVTAGSSRLAAQTARPHSAQTSQQPVFKSGVELIAVDVAIVDRNGNPVAGCVRISSTSRSTEAPAW